MSAYLDQALERMRLPVRVRFDGVWFRVERKPEPGAWFRRMTGSKIEATEAYLTACRELMERDHARVER